MTEGQGEGAQPAFQPTAAPQGEQVLAAQSIYFNGFTLGLSSADINALLLLDGRPVGRLNMSFTTAKTLVSLLDGLMRRFEAATNHDIMTTRQVSEGLQKLSGEEKAQP